MSISRPGLNLAPRLPFTSSSAHSEEEIPMTRKPTTSHPSSQRIARLHSNESAFEGTAARARGEPMADQLHEGVEAEIPAPDDNRAQAAAPGVRVDAENHASMSNPTPISSQVLMREPTEAIEDDGTSAFEDVESWSESLVEQVEAAREEQEPVVDAYFADAPGQEFGLLSSVLPFIVKNALPHVVDAVTKIGGRVLNPRQRHVFDRIRRLAAGPLSSVAALTGAESANEGAVAEALDSEAALETLERQLEMVEVVIGMDDRVQITNTALLPWKRTCHLRIRAADNSMFLGTGFFIGPRTVATAGHCVFIRNHGGWVKDITVTPGRNTTSEPFGSVRATAFRSVKGWVVNNSRNYDYGAMILPRNGPTKAVGAFGFGHFADSFLLAKKLNTAGYPGDKPPGTMWFHGRRATAVSPFTITYDIDTAGGQSGSAVWILDPNTQQRTVVGIHTNGAASGNSATRITKPVHDNLKKWRDEGGVS
jgi:V8-like Glu-specific endopeptidase